jgi:hypothetical protein
MVHPAILVERLHDVVGGRQGQARAQAEGQLGVGKVDQELPDVPLARGVAPGQAQGADGGDEHLDPLRCVRQGREHVAVAEACCVGVHEDMIDRTRTRTKEA